MVRCFGQRKAAALFPRRPDAQRLEPRSAAAGAREFPATAPARLARSQMTRRELENVTHTLSGENSTLSAQLSALGAAKADLEKHLADVRTEMANAAHAASTRTRARMNLRNMAAHRRGKAETAKAESKKVCLTIHISAFCFPLSALHHAGRKHPDAPSVSSYFDP